MITERLTFRARYGHGDELVGLLKESFKDLFPTQELKSARIYTDATGPMFSVAVEMDFEDMAAWMRMTAGDPDTYGSAQFQEWFGRMTQVTEAGERQLLNTEVLR